MHRTAVFFLSVVIICCCSSCSTVQPDGSLKDLVDGELFTGDTRESPPRHENDMLMEPPDTGGPVRWKMRF
jgi:hypothetical protein